jgi:hypothetical protein
MLPSAEALHLRRFRPQYVEEEPEIYEQEILVQFFAVCDDELLLLEFFLTTGMREQPRK